MSSTDDLHLVAAQPDDLDDVARRIQRAFTDGAIQGFGYDLDEPIPSDEDVHSSLRGTNVEVLHIMRGSERVGAASVSIDSATDVNSLDFFVIDGTGQNSGLGTRAWSLIEQRYPQTRIWTTMTPYFDTRNIHFYVNKCGFTIVEFFHARHPDSHAPGAGRDETATDGTDKMFAFEKVMSA